MIQTLQDIDNFISRNVNVITDLERVNINCIILKLKDLGLSSYDIHYLAGLEKKYEQKSEPTISDKIVRLRRFFTEIAYPQNLTILQDGFAIFYLDNKYSAGRGTKRYDELVSHDELVSQLVNQIYNKYESQLPNRTN
jgi:hypothetical protein